MNMKRMRGRNHRSGHTGGGGGGGGGGGPIRHQSGNVPLNRNHVFDSIGPDLRIRGTAQQLFEKYLQLGRDATSSGDRVMAESYFQYAEHYFRILVAMNQVVQQQGGYQGGNQGNPGQPGPQGGQGGGQAGGQGQPGPQGQPNQGNHQGAHSQNTGFTPRRHEPPADQQDDDELDGPETRPIAIQAGAPES